MPDDGLIPVQDLLLQNMQEAVSPRYPGLKWERFQVLDGGTCHPIVILQSQARPDGSRIQMQGDLQSMTARKNFLEGNNQASDVTKYLLDRLKTATPATCGVTS